MSDNSTRYEPNKDFLRIHFLSHPSYRLARKLLSGKEKNQRAVDCPISREWINKWIVDFICLVVLGMKIRSMYIAKMENKLDVSGQK